MRLAGVDDGPTLLAEQGNQSRSGRDDGFEPGDIVAEAVAEAALFDEVALHIDDDQRGAGGVERVGIGLGGDGDHWVPPAPERSGAPLTTRWLLPLPRRRGRITAKSRNSGS